MSNVFLHRARSVNFRQIPSVLSTEQEFLIRSWWNSYRVGHPNLFNGRIIACHSHCLTPAGELEIRWYPTSYSHYLWRITQNPTLSPARTIYCSIAIITDEGRVAVGTMSTKTSSPHRLQLPGGNVEVDNGLELTLMRCAQCACDELAEELGLKLDPAQLALWRVKTGGSHDDVGLIFINSSGISERSIRKSFEDHAAALAQAGTLAELNQVHFYRQFDCEGNDRSVWVDYLPALMREIAPLLRVKDGGHERYCSVPYSRFGAL